MNTLFKNESRWIRHCKSYAPGKMIYGGIFYIQNEPRNLWAETPAELLKLLVEAINEHNHYYMHRLPKQHPDVVFTRDEVKTALEALATIKENREYKERIGDALNCYIIDP